MHLVRRPKKIGQQNVSRRLIRVTAKRLSAITISIRIVNPANSLSMAAVVEQYLSKLLMSAIRLVCSYM